MVWEPGGAAALADDRGDASAFWPSREVPRDGEARGQARAVDPGAILVASAMGLAYLVALILGGGILLIQLLSGDHGDAGDHGLDAHHPLHGPGLLSTRSLTFGLLAFGLVGAGLHLPGLVSPPGALALAAASGLLSALGAGLAFRTIGHPAASGAAGFQEAKGQTARVLVRCARQQRGKIRVPLKGQLVDMMATTDGADIPPGVAVRILEIRDDVAYVVPAPEDPKP